MKTIIKIEQDYYTDLSYNYFIDEINYLVNELNVFCEVRNNKFINVVEEQKRYNSNKEEYKNKIAVSSIGYSQSDWQDYILYYNEEEIQTNEQKSYFNFLIEELKKSFTHFNDYTVTKYEQEEINGKIFNSEPIDFTSFAIRHTEFPNNEDIIQEYNAIYGIDYDDYIIQLN